MNKNSGSCSRINENPVFSRVGEQASFYESAVIPIPFSKYGIIIDFRWKHIQCQEKSRWIMPRSVNEYWSVCSSPVMNHFSIYINRSDFKLSGTGVSFPVPHSIVLLVQICYGILFFQHIYLPIFFSCFRSYIVIYFYYIKCGRD